MDKPRRKSTLPETPTGSVFRIPKRKSTLPEIPLGHGFPTLTPTYTPRFEAEDLLNRSVFPTAEASPSNGKNVIIISGPPASGKTQLILNFVRQNRTKFVETYFIESSSDRYLANGFKKYIQPPGITDPQEALGYLERSQAPNKRPCLIVFNNYAPSIDLAPFLPRSDHFIVLITTQAQPFFPGVRPRAIFTLEGMTSSEAEQILLHRLGPSSASGDTLKRIGKTLVNHPAALSYAAAYMIASKTSPDEYLLRLQSALTARYARSRDFQGATHAALSVSYEVIPSGAHKLLFLLSRLSPNGFPLQLVRYAADTGFDYEMYKGVQRTREEIDAGVSCLKEIFCVRGNFDEDELRRNCDSLKQYELISETQSEKLTLVSMHPEVQSWTQSRLDGKAAAMYQAAAIQLLSCSPRDANPMDEYLALQITEFETSFDQLHTNDKASFASILYRTKDYEHSLPLLKQVSDELERDCGLDHEDTLQALAWLGTAEQANKDHEAARAHRETVVYQMRRKFKAEDRRTAAAEASLAETYASLGQHKPAKDLYEKALNTRRVVLGEDNLDTLATSAMLADVYQVLGRREEAKVLRKDVYDRRKRMLGKDNPNTILAANNLGVTYHDLAMCRKRTAHSRGGLVEGEENAIRDLLLKARHLQVYVLRQRRTTLGEHSPDTQAAMKNLMWTYYELGHEREAEQEARVLCRASTELRGPDDSSTRRAKLALALFQMDLSSARSIQQAIKEDHSDYGYADGIVRTIEAKQLKRPEEEPSCLSLLLKIICCRS